MPRRGTIHLVSPCANDAVVDTDLFNAPQLMARKRQSSELERRSGRSMRGRRVVAPHEAPHDDIVR